MLRLVQSGRGARDQLQIQEGGRGHWLSVSACLLVIVSPHRPLRGTTPQLKHGFMPC